MPTITNGRAIRTLFVAAALGIGALQGAQGGQGAAPDNTKVNKRDRNSSEQTADQGKNNQSDVQLMAHIRREVFKDKGLSLDAHNVKIIAEHGKVTLKGPVRSDEEKRKIEEYARKYAGDGSVTNELTVKGETK